MACGERFTILVYGFVFSRVQTGDGKIGYVYSNMIAVDRAAAPVQSQLLLKWSPPQKKFLFALRPLSSLLHHRLPSLNPRLLNRLEPLRLYPPRPTSIPGTGITRTRSVDRARVGSGHAKSPGNNGARRSACVRTSTRFWIAPAHSSGSGNDRNPGASFFCDHTSGRHVQCPGASRPT